MAGTMQEGLTAKGVRGEVYKVHVLLVILTVTN